MIVAHGHFSRVLISRWINCPLRLGECKHSEMRKADARYIHIGTHFNVEPGGVGVFLPDWGQHSKYLR